MKIRDKILLYFSATVISLTVVSSLIIYLLFAAYREEEFQQRQKQKIQITVQFLTEYKEMSNELTKIIDQLTIDNIYDEKMLIFDKDKQLVYKSVDDLKIHSYKKILNELSPSKQWIETKEGKYDLIGVYVENGQNNFYAISKAMDEFGYTKLVFLRNSLIIITSIISVIVLVITYFLSERITRPITRFAEKLSSYTINEDGVAEISASSSSYEIDHLIEKFNQLAKRTNEAFEFQKQAVQHISHELKTPLAVLVSELEKARYVENIPEKNEVIGNQIVKAKTLGEMINVLLEISKIEAGQTFKKKELRLDDLIFELIEEFGIVHPSFLFDVQFEPEIFDEKNLILFGNRVLIKQAFSNLLYNCIKYSSVSRAKIRFNCGMERFVFISFINEGQTIKKEEEKYLFSHFFRGDNKQGVAGSGLGLVLTRRIVEIHGGSISYNRPVENLNVFDIEFPLNKSLKPVR